MTRSTVPVARPVAWSTLPETTWSASTRLRSGARTVLMSSASSTSVVAGWREGPASLVSEAGTDGRRLGDERHRCRHGVGVLCGGCDRPFAPLILLPSSLLPSSAAARKGNREGGSS